MRAVLVSLLALGVFTSGGAAAARTIVHCGTVIDPARSAAPQKEQSVIIEGDRIVGVESGYRAPGATDKAVDLKGSYCMPGFIDMHTHLSMQMNPASYYEQFSTPPVEQALKASLFAKTTLLAGFTTVRDVGAADGIDFALKKEIARGDIAGPRMFVAGTGISISGGHGDPSNGYREDIVGHPHEEQGVADGVESVTRATRIAVRRGADVIKIAASGGVLSVAGDGSRPQFGDDELKAIVATARDRGRKVAAHSHGDEGARRAVLAGVSSIEHGTYISDETFALMKKHKVYLVPTIIAGKSVEENAKKPGFYPPVVAQKALETGPLMQAAFARAWKAGVPIAFGTDAGVFPHGLNAREFQYMVEAGMPAVEAIRAATQSAADLLGQSDKLGSLAAGKYADLVAVDSDPLADITVLQSVSFVMKAGTVYKAGGKAVD